MPKPILHTRQPITYMSNTGQQRYVITKKTLEKLQSYQHALVNGEVNPGNKLLAEINHFLTEGKDKYDPEKPLSEEDRKQLQKLSPSEFMQLIMNTRQPRIFAESEAIIGDGEMWNSDEYEILGGVGSVLKEVEVYDNGKYGAEDTGDGRYKDNPPKMHLLCIPGAILKPPHTIDRGKILSQSKERDVLDPEKFKQFYKERLLAVFQEANDTAKEKGKKAFITVPGIGNGAFAGEFRGKTIGLLNDTIKDLLAENPQWKNIGCVWLDGYKSSVCDDSQIGDTKIRVRNTGLVKNKEYALYSGMPYTDLGQLSKAEDFAESEEEALEFAEYERFKIFAWDHFSYEGNDWVGGSRATDEANMAACNGLGVMSGVLGEYRNANPQLDEPPRAYFPPKGYRTWENLFYSQNMKQSIADRLFVLDNGNFYQLKPDQLVKKELFEQIQSEREVDDVAFLKQPSVIAIAEYQKQLQEFTDSLESRKATTPKEAQLVEQGKKVLSQIKEIAKDEPEKLSSRSLNDLTQVLHSANKGLNEANDVQKTKSNAKELAALSQHVSGKASSGWKALGIGLLTFACAALVVVGVLAAIPSGGSSLLLTAIGATGLGLTTAAGVGAGVIAAAGVAGAGAAYHGREKELAKSVSDFKKVLSDMKGASKEDALDKKEELSPSASNSPQ